MLFTCVLSILMAFALPMQAFATDKRDPVVEQYVTKLASVLKNNGAALMEKTLVTRLLMYGYIKEDKTPCTLLITVQDFRNGDTPNPMIVDFHLSRDQFVAIRPWGTRGNHSYNYTLDPVPKNKYVYVMDGPSFSYQYNNSSFDKVRIQLFELLPNTVSEMSLGEDFLDVRTERYSYRTYVHGKYLDGNHERLLDDQMKLKFNPKTLLIEEAEMQNHDIKNKFICIFEPVVS